jgi:DNA-binding transcriptional LysR family regulator
MLKLLNTDDAASADELDWHDFQVFLEIVRAGSFNRAAMRLRMTQPTVSRRLARLETSLGVRLFHRDRRGPHLTDDGHRIFNEANAAHLLLSRAATRAPAASKEVEGHCVLSVSEGLASYWLPRFFGPFHARYPRIRLKFQSGNAPEAEEARDLTLQYFAPLEVEPAVVLLATVHILPFASRAYVRQHGMPACIADLGRHCVLDLATRFQDLMHWTVAGRGEGHAPASFVTDVSACLLEAIRCGTGIGLLPSYAAAIDDSLVPIDIGVRFQAPLYAIWRPEAPQRWAVRTTLEFLREIAFDSENMPWFAEQYAVPDADWKATLDRQTAAAALPADRRNLARSRAGVPL